jgi:LPPG:FO 2-phospho-L-lactate transferase
MIVVLAGGVGAARFLEGLAAIVAPERIVAVVNTGDDMIMHGLHISPDLDIVTCTLAGVIDRDQGWGIAGDTDECMRWLGRLGAPTWFKLGDRDLALHIYRTARLRAGATLSHVADEIRRALGVGVNIIPMSDEPAPTHVITDQGSCTLKSTLSVNVVSRRCTLYVSTLPGLCDRRLNCCRFV